MITILYNPSTNTITANVPYINLQRFITILSEYNTLIAQTHLGKNLETNCYIINLTAPHKDHAPLAQHFTNYKKSITLITI